MFSAQLGFFVIRAMSLPSLDFSILKARTPRKWGFRKLKVRTKVRMIVATMPAESR